MWKNSFVRSPSFPLSTSFSIAMTIGRAKGLAAARSKAFSVDRCSSRCKRSAKRSSPQRSLLSPASWLNEDMWMLVMKFLGPGALMRLALVNRAFYRLVMEKSVWKTACHRDLNVPYDATPQFSWRHLYASAVDGSHAYSLHDSDRHIDWIRVGSFQIHSGDVLASGDVSRLALSLDESKNEDSESLAPSLSTAISNVRTGSWIADLHLVKCTLCENTECEGTMQVLDARHWELFLHQEYQEGDWTYEEIEESIISPPCDAASVAILDAQTLERRSTKELLKLESWIFPPQIFCPATAVKMFAAAASTNLTETECENEGLVVKVYTMKAGKDGAVVSIRITQCLAPGQASISDDEQQERGEASLS